MPSEHIRFFIKHYNKRQLINTPDNKNGFFSFILLYILIASIFIRSNNQK